MATVLEQYLECRERAYKDIDFGQFPAERVLAFEELQYRIHVLEVCMNFCKTAPITTEQKILGFHYRVVDAFFISLADERHFGVPVDEHRKKMRVTATRSLRRITESYRKEFRSFIPLTPELYQDRISKMIKGILPVWLEYRNTYTRL